MSGFACACGIACHLIIYVSTNYWLIMFGFVLFGLGIGMGYYPILKTIWKYYPEKKGFLTGLILSVFGLCPMVFTSISDAVVNPNGEDPDDDDYFEYDISKKITKFSLIMALTMAVCGVLSQVLMFPLDNIVSTDNNNNSNNNDNNNDQEETDNNENNENNKNIKLTEEDEEDNEENEDKIENNNKNEDNEPFMQAFKSWRFHLFNLMSVGTLCKFLFFIFN